METEGEEEEEILEEFSNLQTALNDLISSRQDKFPSILTICNSDYGALSHVWKLVATTCTDADIVKIFTVLTEWMQNEVLRNVFADDEVEYSSLAHVVEGFIRELLRANRIALAIRSAETLTPILLRICLEENNKDKDEDEDDDKSEDECETKLYVDQQCPACTFPTIGSNVYEPVLLNTSVFEARRQDSSCIFLLELFLLGYQLNDSLFINNVQSIHDGCASDSTQPMIKLRLLRIVACLLRQFPSAASHGTKFREISRRFAKVACVNRRIPAGHQLSTENDPTECNLETLIHPSPYDIASLLKQFCWIQPQTTWIEGKWRFEGGHLDYKLGANFVGRRYHGYFGHAETHLFDSLQQDPSPLQPLVSSYLAIEWTSGTFVIVQHIAPLHQRQYLINTHSRGQRWVYPWELYYIKFVVPEETNFHLGQFVLFQDFTNLATEASDVLRRGILLQSEEKGYFVLDDDIQMTPIGTKTRIFAVQQKYPSCFGGLQDIGRISGVLAHQETSSLSLSSSSSSSSMPDSGAPRLCGEWKLPNAVEGHLDLRFNSDYTAFQGFFYHNEEESGTWIGQRSKPPIETFDFKNTKSQLKSVEIVPLKCLRLNGKTDFVVINTKRILNFHGVQPFTIEAWICMNELKPFNQVIFSKGFDVNNPKYWKSTRNDCKGKQSQLDVSVKNDKRIPRQRALEQELHMQSNQQATYFAVSPEGFLTFNGFTCCDGQVQPGQWHHIVAQSNHIDLIIYLDGKVVGKWDKAPRANINSKQQPAVIGARIDQGTNAIFNCFGGSIVEMRVWDVAHHLLWLNTYRFRSLTGGEPHLLGYWHLISSDGLLMDKSPNQLHCTLYKGLYYSPESIPAFIGFPTSLSSLNGLPWVSFDTKIGAKGPPNSNFHSILSFSPVQTEIKDTTNKSDSPTFTGPPEDQEVTCSHHELWLSGDTKLDGVFSISNLRPVQISTQPTFHPTLLALGAVWQRRTVDVKSGFTTNIKFTLPTVSIATTTPSTCVNSHHTPPVVETTIAINFQSPLQWWQISPQTQINNKLTNSEMKEYHDRTNCRVTNSDDVAPGVSYPTCPYFSLSLTFFQNTKKCVCTFIRGDGKSQKPPHFIDQKNQSCNQTDKAPLSITKETFLAGSEHTISMKYKWKDKNGHKKGQMGILVFLDGVFVIDADIDIPDHLGIHDMQLTRHHIGVSGEVSATVEKKEIPDTTHLNIEKPLCISEWNYRCDHRSEANKLSQQFGESNYWDLRFAHSTLVSVVRQLRLLNGWLDSNNTPEMIIPGFEIASASKLDAHLLDLYRDLLGAMKQHGYSNPNYSASTNSQLNLHVMQTVRFIMELYQRVVSCAIIKRTSLNSMNLRGAEPNLDELDGGLSKHPLRIKWEYCVSDDIPLILDFAVKLAQVAPVTIMPFENNRDMRRKIGIVQALEQLKEDYNGRQRWKIARAWHQHLQEMKLPVEVYDVDRVLQLCNENTDEMSNTLLDNQLKICQTHLRRELTKDVCNWWDIVHKETQKSDDNSKDIKHDDGTIKNLSVPRVQTVTIPEKEPRSSSTNADIDNDQESAPLTDIKSLRNVSTSSVVDLSGVWDTSRGPLILQDRGEIRGKLAHGTYTEQEGQMAGFLSHQPDDSLYFQGWYTNRCLHHFYPCSISFDNKTGLQSFEGKRVVGITGDYEEWRGRKDVGFWKTRFDQSNFVGLENKGNMCYQNSFIQACYMTTFFRNRLLSTMPADTCINSTGGTTSKSTDEQLALSRSRIIAQHLRELFAKLRLSLRSTAQPDKLKQSLECPWNENEQQDTFMYGTYILDSLDTGLKHGHGGNLIQDTFGGEAAELIRCIKCGNLRKNIVPFSHLSIAIPETYGPVTSIMIVNNSNPQVQVPSGFERLPINLQSGRSSEHKNAFNYSFLCLSRNHDGEAGDEKSLLPITDIVLVTVESGRKVSSKDIPRRRVVDGAVDIAGCTYEKLDFDLNLGGYHSVYLFYDRDPSGNPITEIAVTAKSQHDPAAVVPGFERLEPNLNIDKLRSDQVYIHIKRGGIVYDVQFITAKSQEEALKQVPLGYTLVPSNINILSLPMSSSSPFGTVSGNTEEVYLCFSTSMDHLVPVTGMKIQQSFVKECSKSFGNQNESKYSYGVGRTKLELSLVRGRGKPIYNLQLFRRHNAPVDGSQHLSLSPSPLNLLSFEVPLVYLEDVAPSWLMRNYKNLVFERNEKHVSFPCWIASGRISPNDLIHNQRDIWIDGVIYPNQPWNMDHKASDGYIFLGTWNDEYHTHRHRFEFIVDQEITQISGILPPEIVCHYEHSFDLDSAGYNFHAVRTSSSLTSEGHDEADDKHRKFECLFSETWSSGVGEWSPRFVTKCEGRYVTAIYDDGKGFMSGIFFGSYSSFKIPNGQSQRQPDQEGIHHDKPTDIDSNRQTPLFNSSGWQMIGTYSHCDLLFENHKGFVDFKFDKELTTLTGYYSECHQDNGGSWDGVADRVWCSYELDHEQHWIDGKPLVGHIGSIPTRAHTENLADAELPANFEQGDVTLDAKTPRLRHFDLQSMIQSHFGPEILETTSPCTICQTNTMAEKITCLKTPPLHLILQLKRYFIEFQNGEMVGGKIMTHVRFDTKLDLPRAPQEYASHIYSKHDQKHRDMLEDLGYGLYAIIIHSGDSLNAGHYFTYARESEEGGSSLSDHDSSKSPWYLFNDNCISKSSWENIMERTRNNAQETAYMLLFRRLDTGAPFSTHSSSSSFTFSPSSCSNSTDSTIQKHLSFDMNLQNAVFDDNLNFVRDRENSTSNQYLQHLNINSRLACTPPFTSPFCVMSELEINLNTDDDDQANP